MERHVLRMIIVKYVLSNLELMMDFIHIYTLEKIIEFRYMLEMVIFTRKVNLQNLD